MNKDFFFFDECELRCPVCGAKLMAFLTVQGWPALTCQDYDCPWIAEPRVESKRMPLGEGEK